MKSMLDGLQDSQAAESKELSSVLSATSLTPATDFDGRPSLSTSSLIPNEVPEHLAAELFQDFVDFLLPQFPIAAISGTFHSLRASKPVLLLAAIAAASSMREPPLFRMLHAHLVRKVTELAIIEGDRSLELVQSIIILETWYCPPDDLRRLNFYQWIHIAGTMAMQLGLGGKTCQQEPDLSWQHSEKWRTMFSVFLSCSAVAISLRRQCLVTFTETAQKILDAFDSSTTSIRDKRLVAWVKLQVVAEEVERMKLHGTSFDPSHLLDKFDQWIQSLLPGVMNGMLSCPSRTWLIT